MGGSVGANTQGGPGTLPGPGNGNGRLPMGTPMPKPGLGQDVDISPLAPGQDRSMNGMRMFQAYRNGANMGQLGQMNRPGPQQQQFLPPAIAKFTPGPTPQQIAAQNQQAAMQALQQQFQNSPRPQSLAEMFQSQNFNDR